MIITCIIAIILLFIIAVNLYEILNSKNQILKDENSKIESIDCLLVLGAGIINNERPTLMLKDRLDKSIELYKKGIAPKIIMSGDHSSVNHNEVIIRCEILWNKIRCKKIYKNAISFNKRNAGKM